MELSVEGEGLIVAFSCEKSEDVYLKKSVCEA